MGGRRSGRRGPSRDKRRAILDAAFELFLVDGYAGTTLEQVAEHAGVSRQTVYAHFASDDTSVKETLFRAMVEARVGRRDEPAHPVVATMETTDQPHDDLRTFARHHVALVMRPELVRLRRTIIGEAERFPGIAAAWYANGPQLSFDLFAGWFEAWDRRDLIDVPDPAVAARTFNWLVLSTPLNDAMACADGRSAHDLDAAADEGVRVFLAAHGHADDSRCRVCQRPAEAAR